MALFWGKTWRTKTEAQKIRKAYTGGRGTIRKIKQRWGIYMTDKDWRKNPKS